MKPKFAVECNIQTLRRQGKLYLWTFTFAEVLDYKELRRRWNLLLTKLRKYCPGWRGIRVYEVHPGQFASDGVSHGLHVHVVTNKYFVWETINHYAKTSGWGRIHVVRVRPGQDNYVTKYLSKSRPEALKSWRLWATFGEWPVKTRISDLITKSLRTALFSLLARTRGEMPYFEKLNVIYRWEHAILSGDLLPGLHAWGLYDGERVTLIPRYVDRVTYENRLLPWQFSTRLPCPGPQPSSSPFYSASTRGIDLQKIDIRRNKIADRFPLPVSTCQSGN